MRKNQLSGFATTDIQFLPNNVSSGTWETDSCQMFMAARRSLCPQVPCFFTNRSKCYEPTKNHPEQQWRFGAFNTELYVVHIAWPSVKSDCKPRTVVAKSIQSAQAVAGHQRREPKRGRQSTCCVVLSNRCGGVEHCARSDPIFKYTSSVHGWPMLVF